MLVALCFGFLFSCGRSSSKSSNAQKKTTNVVDLNGFLQTKELLAKYKANNEIGEKVESIMGDLDVYLRANITMVLENNLHRKKTSVADKNLRELKSQFRNGKVSSFSVETRINESIESYNDEHLYNRLRTVSLNLYPSDNMEWDSLYLYYIVSKEWKNEQNKDDIVNQVLTYYGKMLQSNRVLEQMIGVE